MHYSHALRYFGSPSVHALLFWMAPCLMVLIALGCSAAGPQVQPDINVPRFIEAAERTIGHVVSHRAATGPMREKYVSGGWCELQISSDQDEESIAESVGKICNQLKHSSRSVQVNDDGPDDLGDSSSLMIRYAVSQIGDGRFLIEVWF